MCGCADFGCADGPLKRGIAFGKQITKKGVMLRHSKHERSGLYALLSTRAWAFTRTLRVPQGDRPVWVLMTLSH